MSLEFVKQNTLNEIIKLYPDKSIKFHLLEVVRRAKRIVNEIDYEYTRTIEFACLLHDIGIIDGKENHHITGVKRALVFLKSINNEYDFSKAEVLSIMHSIEMHRSSYKVTTHNPYFPLEAQIVNLADRDINYVGLTSQEIYDNILIDTLTYSLNKYSNIDYAINNAYLHLNKKYGINGYGFYTTPLLFTTLKKDLKEIIQNNLKEKDNFIVQAKEFIKYKLIKEMCV